MTNQVGQILPFSQFQDALTLPPTDDVAEPLDYLVLLDSTGTFYKITKSDFFAGWGDTNPIPDYEQLQFTNQDLTTLLPDYEQLQFTNQELTTLLPTYEQLQFTNQELTTLLPTYEQLQFTNQELNILLPVYEQLEFTNQYFGDS
jgi:hypothetical protein